MPTIEQLQQGFSLGEWQVFPARRELRRGDEVAHPEPLQMKVLLSLARRDGDVVTRQELVDECWGGRPIADEPITRCIYQLRRHFGDSQPYQYIDVLVKTGYFLKQPVVLLESAAPAAVSDNSASKSGVVEPAPVASGTAAPAGVRSRRWLAVAALLGLLAVAALAVNVLLDRDPPMASIAVMPFENLTADPDNVYIALGFKEELVHTLQSVPELAVKNVQVSYPGMQLADAGEMLEVDSVLIGALRLEGMELKFSYQLVGVADGINRLSGQVSGKRDRLFEMQEELATRVRSEISGEPEQPLQSSSRPQSSLAYDRYLLGQYLMERRRRDGNLEDAIALFEEAIALDPGFGPAYLALAEIYVLLPDYRGWNLNDAHAEALRIVERGKAADPAISAAADTVYGFVYHKRRMWSRAEQSFQQAIAAGNAEPNAYNWYSLMLGSVGRYDAALEQVSAGLDVFPDSAVLHSRIAIVHAWLGNAEQADLYFARARQLGVGGGTFELAYAIHLMRNNAPRDAEQAAMIGVQDDGSSTAWVAPVAAAMQGEIAMADALAALEDSTASAPLNPQVEATVRTLLGDLDGAVEVAQTLAQPGQTYETEFLFLREWRPVQVRPEFMELMAALRITEYWQESGCQWLDLNVHCD